MARKEKIFHYIYKTTNLLNGKYYYGMHSTDNLEDGYLGSGKRLRHSINKHGVENHVIEILEDFPNRIELAKREKEIINLNEIAKEDCMNLMVGGMGGAQSPEKQRNWIMAGSKAFSNRVKNDAEFRIKIKNHLMLETKKNHKKGVYKYDTFTNKKHTEHTKQLISIKASERTGERNSQYGTCWITNDIENKKIHRGDTIPNEWHLGRIS